MQPRVPALPTFVRVGDENKVGTLDKSPHVAGLQCCQQVVIRECDDYRDVWDDQTHPHDSDSVETCYIVPPGVNVIFEDEYGNEITRCVSLVASEWRQLSNINSVGDFGPRPQPPRRRPFIVQDEDGHVLYR
jgi:hypothetical protein